MYFMHDCQTGSIWEQTQETDRQACTVQGDIPAWAWALGLLWKCSLSFSQDKQTISLEGQYLLTAINSERERAREHFYVNYVNLNSLATRDVRGAIQLSKLEDREGRKIKRNGIKKRILVWTSILEDKNCLCAVTQGFSLTNWHVLLRV